MEESEDGQRRVTRDGIRAAARDPATLAKALDPVAAQAASGVDEALELLLWAVDDLGLALPAIKRIVINEADVEDATGYGERQPVADNDSEEGRALNRRVEVSFPTD